MHSDSPPGWAPTSREHTLAAELTRDQHSIWRDELATLADSGPVHPVAEPGLPAPFLALAARALAFEEHEAAPEWQTRITLLRHYHLELLQRRRVVVLAGHAPLTGLTALSHRYLCEPLDPARMPRLVAAIDHLFALIASVGVRPDSLFCASDAHTLIAGRTFGDVFGDCFYGRYAAPLGTTDQDLLALEREGCDSHPQIALDRRLAGPLLHELSHLHAQRTPISPPYLDECVAAALGARAMPTLVTPDCGDDNAMVGAGWFVQVGEHLIRALGLDAVVAAHAGLCPWSDVLPAGLGDVFATLGWEQYVATRHVAFLGEAQRPEPWIKALWLAIAGQLDRARPDTTTYASSSPSSAPITARHLRPSARATPTATRFVDGWLTQLTALPWSDVPSPAPHPTRDADFHTAARCSFTASPRLTPEGSWRVDYSPVAYTADESQRAWVAATDATGLAFRWVFGPLRPA